MKETFKKLNINVVSGWDIDKQLCTADDAERTIFTENESVFYQIQTIRD